LLFTVILYAFLTFSAGWNISTDREADSQQQKADSRQPTVNSQKRNANKESSL
jgi:hypothetical protein